MANSPLVSIRIPPETLERVDQLAQELYPARRAGKKPNRSQVILDAIEYFLQQHESGFVTSLSPALIIDEHCDSPLNSPLISELVPEEPPSGHPIDEAIQLYPQFLKQVPQYMKPSMRDYVDWWSDYFSYLNRVSHLWFGVK